MIRFEFGHDDLLRTRFAISPLNELVSAHQALADPARKSLHLPFTRAARTRADAVATPLLDALVPARGYTPDFLQPPPLGPLTDAATELERVREVDPAVARAEVGWRYEDQALPAVLEPFMRRPRAGLRALADEMAAYWEAVMAPVWERLRATLDDEIAHRARALIAGGPIEVFGDLHPSVAWRADGIDVDNPHDAHVRLGGRGLQLVPSCFIWPSATAMVDPPWQPALIYPPRGVGLLWEPAARDDAGLHELLGARRAAILAGLDRETSTTVLAARLGASAAGVSEHLGVLRRAGLVRARRQGREVLYGRTAAGDALLRAPGATA